MTTGDVIFCYSFLLHILLSCSFRPYLFVGHIHSCHIALRTKNQIFLIFYINRVQTRVEFRRKLVTADFFSQILRKSLQICNFADFLSNFYDFLHFWRFLRFKNTILCKFADKIPKKRRFCQHRKICFSSRLHRTKRKSKKKPDDHTICPGFVYGLSHLS